MNDPTEMGSQFPESRDISLHTRTHKHLCLTHMDRFAFLSLEGKDTWFCLQEGPSDTQQTDSPLCVCVAPNLGCVSEAESEKKLALWFGALRPWSLCVS